MRRFFLALGVRVEVVTRPLPDVAQPAQGPAKGVFGHPLLRGDLQGLAEQRHRPTRVRIAEVLGRGSEEGHQRVLLVLIQQARAPPACLVLEGCGIAVLAVSPDPVIDALAGHSEHASDIGGRATVVELQHGECTPVEAGISGLHELTTEAPPLPGSELESAHGLLLDRRGYP
jgi:hypothetical protein